MARAACFSAALLALGAACCVEALERPVFDYTFAANCPLVKNFSNTTFRMLYSAEGLADAVDFHIHAAVRPGSEDPEAYQCVLERPGCPMSRLMLCVLDSASATEAQRMAYFTCWNNLPVIYPQQYGQEVSNAQNCARMAQIEWSALAACHAGDRGSKLLKDAAEAFVQRFPKYAHGEQFGVPHVEIDGVTMGPHGWARYVNYTTYLEVLCSKGIAAKVCRGSEAIIV